MLRLQKRDGVEEIPIRGHEHCPEGLGFGEKLLIGRARGKMIQGAAAAVSSPDQLLHCRARDVFVEEEVHAGVQATDISNWAKRPAKARQARMSSSCSEG